MIVNCCPGMENDPDGVPGAADGGAENVVDNGKKKDVSTGDLWTLTL